MECRDVQEWLLQAEDLHPQEGFPAEPARHVAGCSTCSAFAAELARLEADWRTLPVPVEADQARQRFLQNSPAPVVSVTRLAPRLRPVLSRWALAAMLLVAIGAATWFLAPASEAQAGPAVIDQLIDWNLDLAQSSSAAERLRLFAAQEADVRRSLRRAQLSTADRELAQLLFANGSSLAGSVDPLTEAERFSAVAEILVERLQSAADRQDQRSVERFARWQRRVAERGVGASLARAEAAGTPNAERLERIASRDVKRMKALKKVVERNPHLSWKKEIRRSLDAPPRRKDGPKAKKSDNTPQQRP